VRCVWGIEVLAQMLDEIKSQKKLTKNKIKVGELSSEIIQFLEDRNIPIHTKEIYLTHKGLSHLSRDSKRKRGAGLDDEDILKLPEILQCSSSVFFDTNKNKLNLLYCDESNSCKKLIKIVVDTKSYDKKLGKFTFIKTAGYIVETNLNNKFYIKIEMGGR